jgi:hypothetical protein
LFTIADATVVHFCQISVINPAPSTVLAASVDVTVVVSSISPAPDKEAASVDVIVAHYGATVVLVSMLLLLPLL